MTPVHKCIAGIACLLLLDRIAHTQPTSVTAPVAADGKIAFNIPPQALAGALTDLAKQAGITILVDSLVGDQFRSRRLRGTYTIRQALGKLLARTGLRPEFVDDTTIAIIQTNPAVHSEPASTARREPNPDVSASNPEIEKVVVTGSSLKNPKAADSSPLRDYSRLALEYSGAASLAEFSQTMPDNFPSISAVASLYGNTVGAPQLGNNAFLGSGFNLRALGPEATLTLIDGDRFASGGASGVFLDISLLPLNAVDSIVTLTGDTSAVYGSDAIAGVVNVLLKSDIDGAETRVRYGSTKDGGGQQWIFSQLAGKTWQRGNAMIALQYTQQDPVLSSYRSYIPAPGSPIDIVPKETYYGLMSKIDHELSEDTSVRWHFIYGARETGGQSTGFTDYLVKRTSFVELIGGTVHVDYKLSEKLTVGLYGSYSRFAQTLTTFASADGSTQTQPGNSSLGELALSANVDLFELNKQTVNVAFGAGGRKETLIAPTSLFNASYGTLARKVGDIYVETWVPLAEGPHAFLERLELSLVGREDYYQFLGPTFNPKAGLLWSPIADVNFRASYASSFRPAALDALAAIPAYYTVNVPNAPSGTGFTDTLINQSNGISRLKPESARTFTGGVDYRRDSPQGWAASATWFRTIFDNRIAEPLIGSPGPTSAIFAQPELASFITQPIDPARAPLAFTNPGFIGDFAGGGAGAVKAEFDDEPTNVARTLVEGVEASLKYSEGEEHHRLGAFILANYLLRDTYRAAPGIPTTSLLSDVGQAARLRTRAGVFRSMHAWSAALNVNYTSAGRDILVSPPKDVSSWTTVDLQLAYQLPIWKIPVQSTQLTLNARNLGNTAPPAVTVPEGQAYRPVGFDSINASPLGRIVSLELAVTW